MKKGELIISIYLVHHVDVLPADQDPQRHISPSGRDKTDRLATCFRALGVAPARILHSDKQYTIDTALRIAAKLGAEDKTSQAPYPINNDDPIAPFMAEIAAAKGDIIMCGHEIYLLRSIAHLVCGDERRKLVRLKPPFGTAVRLEGAGNDWVITHVWRHDLAFT